MGLALEVSVPEWKPMGALGMLRVDFHFGIGTSSIYAVGSRSAMPAAGRGGGGGWLEGHARGLAPEVSVPEWMPMGALGMLGVDLHFGIGTSSIHAVGSRRHIGLRDDRPILLLPITPPSSPPSACASPASPASRATRSTRPPKMRFSGHITRPRRARFSRSRAARSRVHGRSV